MTTLSAESSREMMFDKNNATVLISALGGLRNFSSDGDCRTIDSITQKLGRNLLSPRLSAAEIQICDQALRLSMDRVSGTPNEESHIANLRAVLNKLAQQWNRSNLKALTKEVSASFWNIYQVIFENQNNLGLVTQFSVLLREAQARKTEARLILAGVT